MHLNWLINSQDKYNITKPLIYQYITKLKLIHKLVNYYTVIYINQIFPTINQEYVRTFIKIQKISSNKVRQSIKITLTDFLESRIAEISSKYLGHTSLEIVNRQLYYRYKNKLIMRNKLISQKHYKKEAIQNIKLKYKDEFDIILNNNYFSEAFIYLKTTALDILKSKYAEFRSKYIRCVDLGIAQILDHYTTSYGLKYNNQMGVKYTNSKPMKIKMNYIAPYHNLTNNPAINVPIHNLKQKFTNINITNIGKYAIFNHFYKQIHVCLLRQIPPNKQYLHNIKFINRNKQIFRNRYVTRKTKKKQIKKIYKFVINPTTHYINRDKDKFNQSKKDKFLFG